MSASVRITNGRTVSLADIPVLEYWEFRSLILESVAGGANLAALIPRRSEEETLLFAVIVSPGEKELTLVQARVEDSFPSLTPEYPGAQAFEREIAEQWGIIPEGHPWLKPLRFEPPLSGKANSALPHSFQGGKRLPSVMDFFRVEGDEVHEVAVGPVHAGVIEPGHFRFQCHGEKVMLLEISLGYQHRGIEKMLLGGPAVNTRHLLETAAGDTTCGHALAYAMNIEALAGLEVAEEALRLRSVALELERIANHTGDLGAMAGDVGYLPTSAYCGRLRGDILNLTALLCGNRFGRGLIVPGGVGVQLTRNLADLLLARLEAAMRDIRGALDLLFSAPSVLARFEGTGALNRDTADRIGLVGPAARASGIETDVRLEQPFAAYRPGLFELVLGKHGDVMDRARQRQEEIDVSAKLIEGWLQGLSGCEVMEEAPIPALQPNQIAVSLVEGWRGRICHVAVTGDDGRFSTYKVVDPSFHNWLGLALALRGQQISDFPLCNKSFNLSYCGHDL